MSFAAAGGAALLVGVLVTMQPRFGGLILAIVVFLMLTAGIERRSIRV